MHKPLIDLIRTFHGYRGLIALVWVLASAALPSPALAQTLQYATAVSAPPDMTAIAARFVPSVVNISVRGVRKVSTLAPKTSGDGETPSDSREDSAMREFLRRFQQQYGGLPPQLNLPVRGEGSGFIVRGDGLILTNAHVVSDADEVVVKLQDRREFTAQVLGSDKPTDIAVLKIQAQNLPAVPTVSPQSPRAGTVGDGHRATLWLREYGDSPESSVPTGVRGVMGRFLLSRPTPLSILAFRGPLNNMQGEVVGGANLSRSGRWLTRSPFPSMGPTRSGSATGRCRGGVER